VNKQPRIWRRSERRMNMKKLLLVLAMTLIALAGCTSQPASTSTPIPPTNTPEAAVTASALAYTVQVTKDIEYTRPLQPDVHAQKLDVYAPEEPGPWPVVIFLPGYGANKDTAADILYANQLAGRGAVVFLPNWRGSMARESANRNGVRWREALEEIACAVRFARSGAADYGGDPGWLTVVGGRSVGEGLV
jgi:acetyl esterase/lipase